MWRNGLKSCFVVVQHLAGSGRIGPPNLAKCGNAGESGGSCSNHPHLGVQ
jgi:hypothetical protein